MTTDASTVLIVEADQATRELYQRELGRVYHVLSSQNARDAYLLLENREVAAVVLEPVLPDDDGWTLLTAISTWKSNESTPIPVIICTAIDERRRGLQLGAASYLVKPVPPNTLLEAVEQAMKSHQKKPVEAEDHAAVLQPREASASQTHL
ncbi:MAG: response regulator [Chloroflexota bacterium]|nr:response regulator [Chloroflexota bacterium]